MAEIVPAILEHDLTAFEGRMIEILKIPQLKRVQVDISDGLFEPNKTIQINELDILSPAFTWEVHLMVQNPRDYLLDAKIAGFSVAIVHFEAMQPESISEIVEEIRNYKLVPVVALNPETPVESIFPYLQLFEYIQLMSIHPGFQGTKFLEETYDRVRKMKNHSKNVIIEVDGGIKLNNARKLRDCGADLLVVGSGLLDNSEQGTVVQKFERFEIEIKTK
jgi:ribulose-phosphate 3-epimerase